MSNVINSKVAIKSEGKKWKRGEQDLATRGFRTCRIANKKRTSYQGKTESIKEVPRHWLQLRAVEEINMERRCLAKQVAKQSTGLNYSWLVPG